MTDPSIVSLLAFDQEDAKTIAIGVAFVASEVAAAEKDSERKARMDAVVAKKLAVLRVLEVTTTAEGLAAALRIRTLAWETPKRQALLVELVFASPFAPYDLEVKDPPRQAALERAACEIALPVGRVKEVLASIASARRAHSHVAWGKIGVCAVLGAIAIGLGGWVLAPAFAGALGGAAGLSGAAAVSHGLALLGGGSLAAGGAGMAGGMIAITGAGAAVGGVGLGGAAAIWQAGYASAVTELVKLQVSYREVLLRAQLRDTQLATVVLALNSKLQDLQRQLAEERALNDSGSPRIKDLENSEKAFANATKWIHSKARS